MKSFLQKYWLTGLGAAIGALAGWLYYIYIGCSGGTCPITSSPVMSTLWGAALVGILFNAFQKKQNT